METHRIKGRTIRVAGHFLVIATIIAMIGWRLLDGRNKVEREGDYPSRPIEVVVPYSAGGGTDTLARLVQRSIARENLLGQPMVIINHPGGSGTIGSRHVKNSKPDGYRILCVDEGMITSKLSGMVPFGPEAFEIIAQSTRNTQVITVRDDSPFKDLSSVLEAAQASPNSIRFGVPLGAPPHFSGMELQKTVPGAEFNFIQSMGAQKRYSLLLGQHIDVSILSLAEVLAYRGAPGTPPDKQIRPLAVLFPERHPKLPEVPTAVELGYDVMTGNALYWWAPKGTPPDRINFLADAIGAVMATPDLVKEMQTLSIDPFFLKGEALSKWIQLRTRALSAVAFDPKVKLPNFPLYAGILVILLAAGVLLFPGFAGLEPTDPADSMPVQRRKTALICGVILLGYLVILDAGIVPYAIATCAMVFCMGGMIASWERRRIPLLLELALLTGFGAEFVFTRIFSVVLP